MTSEKIDFNWDKAMDAAFTQQKIAMISPLVWAILKFEISFVVEIDASFAGNGAVLSRKKKDEKVHLIQFASHTLTTTEKNYSVCDCEGLAVLFALKKFQLYHLSTQPFLLLTDQ